MSRKNVPLLTERLTWIKLQRDDATLSKLYHLIKSGTCLRRSVGIRILNYYTTCTEEAY